MVYLRERVEAGSKVGVGQHSLHALLLLAIGLHAARLTQGDLLFECEANLSGVELLNAGEDVLGASILDERWLDSRSS